MQNHYQALQKSIKKILDELEKNAKMERLKKTWIRSEDRMLAITYETGQFLHSLLVGTGVKYVLELGTSTGYSTLWIADALLAGHKNPRIITVERSQQKIMRARHNFERAGVSKFIKIKKGEIRDVLKSLPRSPKLDFVFVDADKENIIEYAKLILPRLRVGGVIVTDNMLYPKKYRKIMRKYSAYLASRPNLQTCTLDIGNGEEITVKKS